MSTTGRTVSAWTQTRGETGAFASVQRVALPGPVVELSPAGAERLGDLYWEQLGRSSRGILRARLEDDGAREIRFVGIGPALLRFGRAEYDLTTTSVTCRYPIVGGLLARSPGGSISFSQTVEGPVEVRSQVDDFFPRLATRRQRRRWNGLLYPHVQTRLHIALGRRYFERLLMESR